MHSERRCISISRPRFCRQVTGAPQASYFKPAGVPTRELEEVVLNLDEFEAVRLADFESLYQEQAAEKMNVSRQTFGRIIEQARKKIAESLICGKALRIEGGVVEIPGQRIYICEDCGNKWQENIGTNQTTVCPGCHRPVLFLKKG